MRRRWYAFFVLTVALSGCGGKSDDETKLGSPPLHRVPGCERFDVAPCDIETTACQTRLMGLAACLRGSDEAELPPITVMSEDDFATYLEQQYRAEEVDHLAEWQAALSMLSLVAPAGLEMDTRVAESVKNIWGFYSDTDKSVTIVDHGANSNAETSTSVLLHEFVHVLQDREVDLEAFREPASTYDEGLAYDAVVEGEAEFHQERFLASMLGFDPANVDWDLLFENGVEDGEQALLQQDSVMTAAWEVFPYMWGARRVHLGWDATGHAGVLDLFASPPATTRVLMASVDTVATDVEPVAIDAPVAPADWAPLGEDVLGAFGVFEFFGKRTNVPAARELALAWRGDKLAIYGGAGDQHANQVAVVWQLEFADGASAATAAGRLLGEGGSIQVSRDDTRVTLALATDSSSLPWAVPTPAP